MVAAVVQRGVRKMGLAVAAVAPSTVASCRAVVGAAAAVAC